MVPLGKVLIVTGLLMALVGVVFVLAGRIPWIGRLPGDISVERPGFSFHFPVVTCIILSILLTLILNLFFRNR